MSYHTSEAGWTLCVRDDGIGMARAPEAAKLGLGTSLVQALARQLKARVAVADQNPGTTVSIIHMSDGSKSSAGVMADEPAI